MRSSLWVIIPGQSFDRSKTRLSPVLGPAERKRFSRACLIHVVQTARRIFPARQIVVVSAAAEVLGLAKRLGVIALRETGAGLNKAVSQASRYAQGRGAKGVIAIHGDLPGLKLEELKALRGNLMRHQGVVLAPDEACEGSNALAMRPAGKIRYRFGPGSFKKHCAETRRARARLKIIRLPGLARDIDTPENYGQFQQSITQEATWKSQSPVVE